MLIINRKNVVIPLYVENGMQKITVVRNYPGQIKIT